LKTEKTRIVVVTLQSQNLKPLPFYLVLVSFLPEKKRAKAKKITEKKKTAPVKQRKRPASMLEPYRPSDLWINFDRAFERFRRDFEDILWPSESFPMMSKLGNKNTNC